MNVNMDWKYECNLGWNLNMNVDIYWEYECKYELDMNSNYGNVKYICEYKKYY